MKHTLIIILFLIQSVILLPQTVLVIEGQEIVDTETGVSNGYNIPRNQVTVADFSKQLYLHLSIQLDIFYRQEMKSPD